MLAAICAIVLATRELVCSAPVQAPMADLLVEDDGIHLFGSGGAMFDTRAQPTTHPFTIREDDARWPRALAASAPKHAT